jgi:hypothetical protein
MGSNLFTSWSGLNLRIWMRKKRQHIFTVRGKTSEKIQKSRNWWLSSVIQATERQEHGMV